MYFHKTAAAAVMVIATGALSAMAAPLPASAPAAALAPTASAPGVPTPASAPLAVAAPAAPSAGLLLADITRLSRQRVLNELQGTGPAVAAGLPMGTPGLPAGPLPPALMQPPVALPGAAPVAVPGRAAPKLHFTGLVRGSGAATVMYMAGGTIYSARVGETLSNGWKLVGANDAGITVSSCGAKGRSHCRTWTEPMAGLVGSEAGPDADRP